MFICLKNLMILLFFINVRLIMFVFGVCGLISMFSIIRNGIIENLILLVIILVIVISISVVLILNMR